MKKIFTLVAVALSAISANAQTESWNVNNTDGTLKTDDYKAQMQVLCLFFHSAQQTLQEHTLPVLLQVT